MTPVDPFARPDLPDTGPVGPSSGITDGGASSSEPFDYFTPTHASGTAQDPRFHLSAPRESAPPSPESTDPAAEAPPSADPRQGSYFPVTDPRLQTPGTAGTSLGGARSWDSFVPPPRPEPGTGYAHAFGPDVGGGPGAGPVPAAEDPPTLELGDPFALTPPGTAPGAAPTAETTGPIGGPIAGSAAATADEPAGDLSGVPAGPLYVVGDVHGYLDELLASLRARGIIDAEGSWIAGRSRIWFLGDFTDRGPDGIGVIELVMRLAAEAAAAGGYCRALMGNHELLLLGAAKFHDSPVPSSAGTASFMAAWRLNGGQQHDLERLEDHHIAWLSRLPAMAVEDGHLLLHSDATVYRELGTSVDEVNDAVHAVLQRADSDEWWETFRRFTKRFAFRGEDGPAACRELLDIFGGHRIVHGHSPIPYLLGDVDREDAHAAASQVTAPHVYAEKLAVAMDGGVTMEGPMLIARLPLEG